MAFNPNYEFKNFSEETYNFKEHYNTNWYVIFNPEVFNIVKNCSSPTFSCYLKVKSDKYGDPSAPLLDAVDVRIRVIDSANGIVVDDLMVAGDTNLGEWTYKFSPFDFTMAGQYEAQIITVAKDDNYTQNTIAKCKVNVED